MYGNKIDNLVKLKANGINIPEFWIVGKDSIENLEDGLYAVRSSSNMEDNSTNSFAGQFDTYLNIDKSALNEKIECCKKSLNNENIQQYVKKSGLKQEDLEMNVFIQKMVQSEISGVIFSCNPLGLLNEIVISVAKGLGENVVQDKVNSVNYYYNTTDNTYYYEGNIDLLTQSDISKIISLVTKIQDILDYNLVDIEFAIENNTIYILQAREITTIDQSHPLVLDNSNIVESYPGTCLPLTISFVEYAYSSIFRNVCSRVLKDNKLLENYNEVFNNMVGNANGRVYYKISNWYYLIKLLPFSNKIIPIWQEMLGVKNKEYTGKEVKTSLNIKFKIAINFIKELRRVTKNMDTLSNKFLELEEYFNTIFPKTVTNKEILELYSKLSEDILQNWDITLINDMYAFIFTGISKKLLSKNKEITDVNEYITGISNIESLKPIKALVDLAYSKNSEDFETLKQEFITLYGDRTIEELKLESKTFKTNPEMLDQKIEEYSYNKGKLSALKNRLYKDDEIDYKVLKPREQKILNHCITGIKNRELSRLNRTRLYGMVRSMMLKISNNLKNENKINTTDDIFYLTLEEITNTIENDEYNIDLKSIIQERKEKYNGFKQLPAYSRLIFSDKEFDKIVVSIESNSITDSKNNYTGVPCSPGNIDGEVAIVDDISDTEKYRGKILVTKMTDPGWVYLIAISKGIISEKGSLLSHTAIISRELKIPFITSVTNATNIFKTGDSIQMDGVTGEIRILKRAS